MMKFKYESFIMPHLLHEYFAMSQNVVQILIVAPLQVTVSWGHGRLMEPPSRASMWRLGYPNPADYNDNQGFCGGFQVRCKISA